MDFAVLFNLATLPTLTHFLSVTPLCSMIDIIPRSVLMVMFDDHPYLLCALGNGSLHYYQMDLPAGKLSTPCVFISLVRSGQVRSSLGTMCCHLS